MNREEIISEIARIKSESDNLQRTLVEELRTLDSKKDWQRVCEILVSHGRDLNSTCYKVSSLERELSKFT